MIPAFRILLSGVLLMIVASPARAEECQNVVDPNLLALGLSSFDHPTNGKVPHDQNSVTHENEVAALNHEFAKLIGSPKDANEAAKIFREVVQSKEGRRIKDAVASADLRFGVDASTKALDAADIEFDRTILFGTSEKFLRVFIRGNRIVAVEKATKTSEGIDQILLEIDAGTCAVAKIDALPAVGDPRWVTSDLCHRLESLKKRALRDRRRNRAKFSKLVESTDSRVEPTIVEGYAEAKRLCESQQTVLLPEKKAPIPGSGPSAPDAGESSAGAT